MNLTKLYGFLVENSRLWHNDGKHSEKLHNVLTVCLAHGAEAQQLTLTFLDVKITGSLFTFSLLE